MTEVVHYLESMLLYSLPVQVPDDRGCPLFREYVIVLPASAGT